MKREYKFCSRKDLEQCLFDGTFQHFPESTWEFTEKPIVTKIIFLWNYCRKQSEGFLHISTLKVAISYIQM